MRESAYASLLTRWFIIQGYAKCLRRLRNHENFQVLRLRALFIVPFSSQPFHFKKKRCSLVQWHGIFAPYLVFMRFTMNGSRIPRSQSSKKSRVYTWVIVTEPPGREHSSRPAVQRNRAATFCCVHQLKPSISCCPYHPLLTKQWHPDMAPSANQRRQHFSSFQHYIDSKEPL